MTFTKNSLSNPKSLLNIVLLLGFSLLVSNASTAQSLLIKGQTTGLSDSTKVSIKNMDDNSPVLTAYTSENTFSFQVNPAEEADKYLLRISGMESNWYRFFFVEDTDITIDARDQKYLENVPITGGEMQGQQTDFMAWIAPKKHLHDSYKAEYSETKDPNLKQKYGSLYWELRTEDKVGFIKEHPDSKYAAYLIEELSMNLSNKEAQDLYDGLSPVVKNSKYGKRVARYLNLSQDMIPGAMAKNFELNNLKGELVEFDSFKGNYVYLDFWASWCGPCRKQHPGLLELYERYNQKGFEIVSISLDFDETKWRKAVEQDKLIWTNLVEPEGTQGDVSLMYKVQAIPTSYLIDPEGKIVASYFNGRHDLDERLATYFPEN
ncbi:TlpA family protein disulfide reductase [Leeuwenhoekiella nanhaiensis]|uniref:Thioredoxin domain-containing protein n=1 Tax=Leeuwenhoekiella nanhaiensis TaxID=1655491 RepID=A0A2G1VQM6_9FLAO|nr:TlpA family protein disulfide reductase [Leeuwenhoekiella nanhaiensis]PHQ29076.1 hypothetical protein CJ305_10705 [Leeuwenhoekiella nanhaiensis]